MRRLIVAALLVATTMMAAAQGALKKVYDETLDPMEQIDKALADVRASGADKYVVCQVGGNWCPWCLRFADFITTDNDIAKVVDENFVYLHVNYNPRKAGGEAQAQASAALMNRLGQPQRFGFPVLVVLNQDGQVLHIQDSGLLEKGEGYDKEKVLRFFKSWTPKAVGSGAPTAGGAIEAIRARRSIRKYLDKPVEHEKLATIAQCGIMAPSGMNSQRWAVRVVESPEWIAGTTALFKQANPDMAARDANFKNMFRNAPSIICVATPDGEASLDAGMLGENMMIAAQSLGLGTCCLGGPVRFLNTQAECKPYIDQLNLPEGYRLSFIVAVGYPDERPEARPRDEGKIEYIR